MDERSTAAEVVAVRLGELVLDTRAALVTLPRWRPAPFRIGRVVGGLDVGIAMYDAWVQAFGIET